MKYVILITIVVMVATIVVATPRPDGDDKYPTKYDNIDVDAIIGNERLFNNYVECIRGKGKCTPEGEELKRHLKDGIQTCCEKCTEKQKEGVRKVFTHLEKNKPDVLKQLKDEHDPTGEHEKICREKIKQ